MNQSRSTTAGNVRTLLSRCALQSLFMALALVAYGSIPRTALVQTEVESEILVQGTDSSTSIVELRRGLRSAASQKLIKRGAAAAYASSSPTQTARYIDAIPSLSAGLAVPLRC